MELPAWPQYEDDEIEAAMSVLRMGKVNYWTGEQGRLFEKEFAEYCSSSYGVAVANGSVGLDVALHSLGIGPGDEVIVSCRSFFASAGSIALTGATPVFADVNRSSQNISVDTIEPLITDKTKAILCVHLYGWPCDMPNIIELAHLNNLATIEDCAQAHGAKVDGKPVGSWGDVGVFSFCQDKIMTTGGEGGMIVTDRKDVWEKAWSYKDHGKNYNKVFSQDHPPGFRWLHDSVGSNYRMTEMQSAIGRLQLEKLDSWVAARRANANLLEDALTGLASVRLEKPDDKFFHAYYKYGFFIEPQNLASGWSRERILDAFGSAGIPAFTGSCPEIYLEKAFDTERSNMPGRLPVAKELGETSLQFLVHPTIEPAQMRQLSEKAGNILSQASGA